MPKYRKKPVVIDAFQWTEETRDGEMPGWFHDALNKNKEEEGAVRIIEDGYEKRMKIFTLEGIMTAHYGDYVIRGIKHEIYNCKADIFKASYESLEIDV